MDDQAPMDRTPYNERADFREAEVDFRSRLDSLVPDDLSERIQSIITRREEAYLKNKERKASGE